MPSFDFGVHYSCQSPAGDFQEVYQGTVAQARVAESLGFESFSVAEHHFLPDGWVPAPFVMLGALSAATEDVRLGTNVAVLPLHDPVRVAERAAVLDVLTGGSFRLGVSLGWRDEEFEAFGVPRDERVTRLDEGIELVSRLLTEESVTFEGECFAVEDLTVMPRPVQESVPVWCGGQSRPAIRRAAALADVWSISPIESREELAESVEIYREGLADYGRSYEDVHVPLRREVYVAEDDETAWEEAGEAVLREYQDVYGDYDAVEETFEGLDTDAAVDRLREHASGRFVVGGPETAVEEFERFHDVLEMDEVLIRTHFPGLDLDLAEKSLRIVSEEVMPHFE
jgi:probable F420-dependent oxidoreductase